MNAYECYGKAAEQLSSPTVISGRNTFQSAGEQAIIPDVIQKLRLQDAGRLLEIGCGVGTLLTPLSRCVAEAVGIDHPSCIAKYKQFGVPAKVRLLADRWPSTRCEGTFDRILVYSVLHTLADSQTARVFIDACLAALKPGGGLLLGDVPNEDKRQRFLQSNSGKQLQAEYDARRSTLPEEDLTRNQIFAAMDPTQAFLGDDFLFQLLTELRQQGYESYVTPQPPQLPFSWTREDLLIWSHA